MVVVNGECVELGNTENDFNRSSHEGRRDIENSRVNTSVEVVDGGPLVRIDATNLESSSSSPLGSTYIIHAVRTGYSNRALRERRTHAPAPDHLNWVKEARIIGYLEHGGGERFRITNEEDRLVGGVLGKAMVVQAGRGGGVLAVVQV